jgi:hypothetical protein
MEKMIFFLFVIEPEFYIVDQTSDTVTSIRLKTDLDEDLPIKQNILARLNYYFI